MLWHIDFGTWLIHSALFGAILLSLGVFAVWRTRQPVYRIRIIQCTFIGCLLVPWLQQLDILPGYSLNFWNRAASNEPRDIGALDDSVWHERVSVRSPIGPRPHGIVPHSGSAADPRLIHPPETPGTSHVTNVEETPPAPESTGNSVLFSPMHIMQAIYATGVGFWLILWGVGLFRRHGIAKRAAPADPSLYDVLASIAGPRAKSVRLLVCDRVDSPIMWGLWRPTIVVPKQLASSPDSDQLRWGLAHEWSHVVRHDFGVQILADFVKIACFYQPAYWWLKRQLTLSQDYLADAFAAEQGASPEDYADFLVSLARSRQEPRFVVTLGISGRRSSLYRRVQMLVAAGPPLLRRGRRRPALIIVALALITVAGLGALRLNAAGDNPKQSSSASEASKPQGEQTAEPARPAGQSDANKSNERPDPVADTGTVVDRTTDEASERKRTAAGLRLTLRGRSNEGLIGELIERPDWKQAISFAPWQADVILKLDSVLIEAWDDSFIRDADYVEAGHDDYRQYVDRGRDRRSSVRYHGQEIVQLGLLTEAQAAFVMYVAYSRGEHNEYGYLGHRLIQSRLNLTSDQLGFLDKLNDWAIVERLQLNHWTHDPVEKKSNQKERQRIQEQHSAFALGVLSPEQLSLWNDLIAPKPKPDIPAEIPGLELRKRDIAEEHLSLFTYVKANREALGLTDRQNQQLADLEDVLRTGIAFIHYRQEEFDSGEKGQREIQEIVRHAQDIALIGILSQEQERKTRQDLNLPPYQYGVPDAEAGL